MKKQFLVILFLFNEMLYAQKPKLVIGVVVDQMRVDYLYRYYDKYGEGGFKKLMNGGFQCKNTNYNYVPTYTGPGHASIYTGTTPRVHGIISNNWYDKTTGKYVYCADDKTVKALGGIEKAGQMSPRNMLCTTIGDELKLSNNQQSKVIGIALKDRSAIMPAGHSANAAYWYDGSNGAWISSSYYMEKLPDWVTAFNAKNLSAAYLSKDWTTLLPIDKYTESMADDNPYENTYKGETKPVFPHQLAELKDKNKGFDLLRVTPFGNSLTKDFVLETIKNENMGLDNITDFLTISFSSTDYIGHQFGINAIETEDTYLRLDKDIEELITSLEKNIGKENFVLFLTADHGAVNTPQYLEDLKIPAGYVNEKMIADSLKKYFKNRYGDTLVLSYSNQQFFLNHDYINAHKYKLKEITQDAVLYLIKLDGIAEVYTSYDVLQGASSDDVSLSRIFKGYNQKRSGDIIVNYYPAWIEGEKKGTTHGAAYSYDTHVPLLWYGWKIKLGGNYEPVNITDIAATVCSFLDISFPNGSIGKPITYLVK